MLSSVLDCSCHPPLVKVATKYKANKKLVILGVTGENAKKKADTHKFMKKHGATWKVAMAARKSMGAYKIKFYPTTIVVDHNGKVFWHSFMANAGSLEEAVGKALKAAK